MQSKSRLKCCCATCAGAMPFDVQAKKILCKNRNALNTKTAASQFAYTQFWQNAEDMCKEYRVLHGLFSFTCTACATQLNCTQDGPPPSCPNCSNNMEKSQDTVQVIRPDYILPFKVSKAEAQKLLKKFCRRRPFLPCIFKQSSAVNMFMGVYMPFWIFSGKSEGQVFYRAQRLNSFYKEHYTCTQIDNYDIMREGGAEFAQIPMQAFDWLESDFPWPIDQYDLDELMRFCTAHTNGYYMHKINLCIPHCYNMLAPRVVNSTRKALISTVKGYTYVMEKNGRANVGIKTWHVSYALLPTWLLTTTHNGQLHHLVINGQTGKISGRLPIDIGKKRIMFYLLIAAFYVPIAAIFYAMFFM